MALRPIIEGLAGGNSTSDATSHTVNLPSSIAAGEMLFIFIAFDGNPTITWPEGWTELHTGTSGTAVRLGVAYKVATGSEGASVTVRTSASEMPAYVTMRVSGYEGSPECSTGAASTGATINADSLTPSGGSDQYLWLIAAAYDNGQRYCSSESFGLGFTHQVAGTTSGPNQRSDNVNGCGVVVMARRHVASSFDPGSFEISYSQAWRAVTIALAASADLAPYAYGAAG